jgi:hypothetical protein
MTTLSLRDPGFVGSLNSGDPYFANVSLLLHGNGTNGSTTIVDSGKSPKTVTVSGNARISTEQSKFGGSSLTAGTSPSFSWGSNRLQVPAGVDFAYTTNDFTAEAWIYLASFAGDPSWWTQAVSGTNYFICGVNPSGLPFFTFGLGGGGTTVYGPGIIAGTWNHVAIVRVSGVATVYLNGIGGAPVSCATNFSDTTLVPTIGSYAHNASQLVYNGFIDELRITKNIARYTANFTPPTAPFPDF